MNSKLAIAAVLSAVSVVFASVGPAHAEYGDTYTVDQSFREQSALMEGVDPEVWLMSDDQLIALGESESVLDNPARDLIADRVATESGLGGNGQGDSDRPSLNQDGLRQALSDLVEPAADIDTVRQVLSDPELAPVIDQGQKSVETLPTIEGQSGKVTLSHPAKSEYTISISPKDAAIVNTQKGVVESKNEHTGVLSVSQVTADMGGQVVSVLPSPDSPYADFNVDLPNGYTFVPKSDGSLSIRDTLGEEEGEVEKAWAVDADGKRLETSYEVLGDGTLRQHVNTKGAAFPIVADPSVQWWVVTAAKCAGEIAIAFTPFKVAKVVASLNRIIKTSKVVAKAVKALGGVKNAAVAVMKYSFNLLKSKLGKWGSKMPSFGISAYVKKHAKSIFSFVGWGIFDALGFGGCGALIAQLF